MEAQISPSHGEALGRLVEEGGAAIKATVDAGTIQSRMTMELAGTKRAPSPVFRLLKAVACVAVFYLVALRPATSFSQQGATASDNSAMQFRQNPTSDFEVKVVAGGGRYLVRRKGTLEWTPSSQLSEAIAVGSLDDGEKVYLGTKAIKPPKAGYLQSPEYPESEAKSGSDKQLWLDIVVDELGNVLIPAEDTNPGPFKKSAIEAVRKWKFKPAKLDGRPVAVLMAVSVYFRHP